MDTLAIIKRIEFRLIEIGMDKNEFYKMSGVSSASYSQWKTGKYNPSKKALEKIAHCLDVSVDYLMGFGELDLVLPPNMQGANLSGAKIDSQFLNYILSRFSQIDQQNPRYESTRNAVLSIAKSSGLEEMAKSYIFELESRNKVQKEKPTPVSESGPFTDEAVEIFDSLSDAQKEKARDYLRYLKAQEDNQ